jgi:membrane fusion protein (multidrug efflux system)
VASEPRDGSIRVELALQPPRRTRLPLQHGLPGTAEVEVERVTPAVLVLRTVGKVFDRPIANP